MLKRNKIFNDRSVCIFTDAGYHKGDICAGFCTYRNDILIDQDYNILHNETSQRGELFGILMGVMNSFVYGSLGYQVRLFSDSLNSILAIRNRIFKWVQMTNNGQEILLGPDGSIKNQDFIFNIINEILSNGIKIELYHVKGHVNIYNQESFLHAKQVFKDSNNIDDVEDNLIRQIAISNDQVDRYLAAMMTIHQYDEKPNNHMVNAISYSYDQNLDLDTYSKLVYH